MKKLRILLCLALAAVLCLGLAACGETAEEPSGGYKVTFYDSDGVTVLAETTAEEGQPVADPGLTKEGYVIRRGRARLDVRGLAGGLPREQLGPRLAAGRLYHAARGG